jgi:tetratricopeptide (TPR) repeat protein
LKKKLEEDPESLVFVPLAEAYRKEGSLDDAYRVCKKGLEKNPDYSNAHLVLGRIYQGQTKLDDAVAEFKKVLEIDPENLMAHSLLGSVFVQKTDYKAAIDAYQAVLTLNPDDEETQKLLKVAIEKAANLSTQPPAKETKTTEHEPKADEIVVASATMAELYLKQGHPDKAIEVYEELLKKDPNNTTARKKLIELKEKAAVNSFGAAPNKTAQTPATAPKLEKSKQAHLDKEKDAKFSDDDILQVMSMGNEKAAKVPEKSAQSETKNPEVRVETKESEKPKAVAENQTAPSNNHFSPARIEALKVVLAELAGITGIRRCFLTSLEGISVVSVGENSNNDSLEKQTLSIFKDTSQSSGKLNQGSLQQVLVTAETGHILLVSFAGGILVVLADHQINLGMLRLAMDGAAKKVEKVS